MKDIEDLISRLKEFDPKIKIHINDQKELSISSEELEYEHNFEISKDEDLYELEKEINTFIEIKILELEFKEIASNIEISHYGDNLIVKSSDWDKEIDIELNDGHKTIKDLVQLVNNLKTYIYIPCELCYGENYAEYLISFNDWRHEYLQYNLYGTEDINTKISYEITPISQELLTLIRMKERYDTDEFNDENLITLKIKNINSVIGIEIEDQDFHKRSEQIAKSIIFDISSKYSVDIYLTSFMCSYLDIDDDVEDVEEETIEKRCILTNNYDTDLISYYYEAMQMDMSQFQYMAFYRVIECIFDEVYKHETVQDIKHIINSNYFSSYDEKDIVGIIEIVEKFQRQKTDREKIRLVFEKYLKGSIRDEVYYKINERLIKILKEDLKIIKNDKELKDYQKIGDTIYDFRCKCAHSNRAFNFRGCLDNNDFDKLDKYIDLIKEVCQRIIVNYSLVNIGSFN